MFQQYVCYTTLLNMIRAARCSSSGGQIVSLQPLVSSPSVNSRTVCGLRADSVRSQPSYCTNMKSSNMQYKTHIAYAFYQFLTRKVGKSCLLVTEYLGPQSVIVEKE